MFGGKIYGEGKIEDKCKIYELKLRKIYGGTIARIIRNAMKKI